jgi:hypothetical protein
LAASDSCGASLPADARLAAAAPAAAAGGSTVAAGAAVVAGAKVKSGGAAAGAAPLSAGGAAPNKCELRVRQVTSKVSNARSVAKRRSCSYKHEEHAIQCITADVLGHHCRHGNSAKGNSALQEDVSTGCSADQDDYMMPTSCTLS